MKADHSFEKTLCKWVSAISPMLVIEWGPGKSTRLIHELAPSARIISIESQDQFFLKATQDHKYAKIVLCRIPEYGPSEYSCWPSLREPSSRFDLAFIDGRQRVSCLVECLSCLSDDGVAILHDADRKHYQNGISLFNVIDSTECTVVLRKKS